VGGQHHDPAALPPGKTQYHWLGGLQDQSGQVQNISSHRNSTPWPSNLLRVSIPTTHTLTWLTLLNM